MPTEDVPVLVTQYTPPGQGTAVPELQVRIAVWYGSRGWNIKPGRYDFSIIAWMPLPDPAAAE